MRRIICFILLICTLCTCMAMTISAATSSTGVMADLATLQIDGVPFNEATYPKDTSRDDLEILATVESGYRTSSSSPSFAFYLYVYNPGCIPFKDVSVNSMQVGVNERCDEYKYVGLKLLDQSDDGRFLKLQAVSSSGYGSLNTLYVNQDSDSIRVYNVASLRLYANSQLTTYPIKLAFYFSGSDLTSTLSCATKELEGIDTEIHFTNWISPNAGTKTDDSPATIYDHYEINTAYFTLPKSYFVGANRYDYIQSIRAIFDRIHLTPIIVTRAGKFDATTKEAILKGYTITDSMDVMDLTAFDDLWWTISENRTHRWIYTESEYLRNLYGGGSNPPDMLTSLAYYFESSKISEDFDFDDTVAVSAEELEAYFLERYNDPAYDNTKLFTEQQRFVLDYNSTQYGVDALYEMETSAVLPNLNKWYYKWSFKNDQYIYQDFDCTAEKIHVITDPSVYASISEATYETYAKQLYLGVNDVGAFSELCAEAAANDEVVVLLRFGFSSYHCSPVQDLWEKGVGMEGPVALAIDKYAYMNVNLVHVVFSKDGQAITVPMVSNTGNSFGDITIFDPPGGGDLTDTSGWKDYGDVIKTILIVLGIILLVVLFIIFFPVIRGATSFVGAGLSTAGDALERRRRQKNKKDKE